jgi:hypothetical protein
LASLCCLRRTTILPKAITHVVVGHRLRSLWVGTVTKGGDRIQSGAVGLCTAINRSAPGIWDSNCTVNEKGQVVVAIVNMTSDRFDLVSGDCVGAMSNSVFEADGGIHKLNEESVNTIFGNIGKVPDDPKWGKGPPLEPKEKKVLKERLQVLVEEPWRQQYFNLMLRTGVKGIITYIDDILVHLRNHEQHLKSIKEVLWRLRKYGLKLNVDKTIIGARTVQYLGYTLSGQGVTLLKDKLAAIKDFPMPMLPKAVQEFLGLANYFRSLIPRFSQTADPLNKTTRASTVWRTGAPPRPEAQVAFNKLKEALMSAPIIVNPNREGRFILQTDASTGTVGRGRHGGRPATRAKGQDRASGRVHVKRTKGPRSELPGFPTRKGRGMLGD